MRKCHILGIALVLLTAGCFNGANDSITLSNVSIGQQMIDLKKALEQDAINQQEYDRLKRALMAIEATGGESDD